MDAGSEVWNQPIRGYQIYEQNLYTPTSAAQKFLGRHNYPFNIFATQLLHVRLRIWYVVESSDDGPHVLNGKVDQYTRFKDYEYLLELDNNDMIIGGEWVGNSIRYHPDFVYFPLQKPDISEASTISYANIQMLLDVSSRSD